MNRFQVHDGRVAVKSGSLEYQDTLANFSRDFGFSPPGMPPGVIGVLYEQDAARLSGTTGDTQVAVPEAFRGVAERALAALPAGVTACAARRKAEFDAMVADKQAKYNAAS